MLWGAFAGLTQNECLQYDFFQFLTWLRVEAVHTCGFGQDARVNLGMAIVFFILSRTINWAATCKPSSPPSIRRGLSIRIGIRLLCYRIYATDNPQEPIYDHI